MPLTSVPDARARKGHGEDVFDNTTILVGAKEPGRGRGWTLPG